MKQIITIKEIKGKSGIIIPKGTILPVYEDHRTKYLVRYINKYWFIDKHQAKMYISKEPNYDKKK